MKRLLLLLIIALISTSFAFAQSEASIPQTILLKDGTSIKGKLINIANDVLTVETKSMGAVQIKSSDVKSIHMGKDTPSSSQPQLNNLLQQGTGGMQQQFQQLQQNLMADPNMKDNIQELLSNEQLVELLQDESLQKAIATMNFDEIQKNPAFQQIIQDPKLQQVIQEAGKGMGLPSDDTATGIQLK